MVRTAVFDLDGTLADTSGDLLAAANACFDTPMLRPETDRATAFLGGRAMLRLGLTRQRGEADEAVVNALYPQLLAAYEAGIDRETRLYPGVEAALDSLAGAGWHLAVCTNKPIGLAEILLTRLGLRARFRAVLGADSLPVRKPDPLHYTETVARAGGLLERSALIGDTETDRKTAEAAGVPCILVGFAPGGVPEAHDGPVLAAYGDLPALLTRLLP